MAATTTNARFVVAVDFGTTFSGYAYIKRSEPGKVFTCYDWPYFAKAGAKPYCKTLTALYYVPRKDKPGTFTLEDWGWSAFLKYMDTTKRRPAGSRLNKSLDSNLSEKHFNASSYMDAVMVPQHLQDTVGFFAIKFKLYLAEDAANLPHLPGDITVERMIVDYLKLLSEFIMSDLQQKYGRHVTRQDVQWCLTVPAIWDERAKQRMKICAEKGGMVRGARCPNPLDSSPHPLDIILEPEGASVYCQHKAKDLNLRRGDKMLIADIGGGTIDLVVHEKADDDPESMNVDEVVGSYGELGGGTFVDRHLFDWVCQKIGCFKQFCGSNLTVAVKLYDWWQSIKMGFDGDGYSAEWPLPRKLSEAWEDYDAEHGSDIFDDNYYDELRLEDSHIKQIFDKEVDKVLGLIQKQIQGVRILMVVGGFSACPYLRKRVKEVFGDLVEEIITPEDPGSAICHGAVQLHIGSDIIKSRIAKRTYGIRTCRDEKPDDPIELCFIDDDGRKKCGSIFHVFVRAGDKVPLHECVTRVYNPAFYNQKAIEVILFSSPNSCPRYTTDAEAKEEGSFFVDISEDMELGSERNIEISMCFGASLISVTARRMNFGDAELLNGFTVSFSGESSGNLHSPNDGNKIQSQKPY